MQSADPGGSLPRILLAEALGTLLLLCVVVGSGIMAEQLSAGNAALALLANTLATVAGLYVLIELLAPLSGAHFNPLVTVLRVLCGDLAAGQLLPYILAQLGGAALGAWLANAMFAFPVFECATRIRSGHALWLSEGVATAGLLLVVLRAPPARASQLIAAWIGAAYWFTASTAFANPAAAFGRMLSDSFAGIAPASVPGFVLAECIGAAIALGLHRALGPVARSPDPTAGTGSAC